MPAECGQPTPGRQAFLERIAASDLAEELYFAGGTCLSSLYVEIAGEALRVELVHYDFDLLEQPTRYIGRLAVQPLRDALANKLAALIERREPKDFADVYYLVARAGLGLEQGVADCARKFGFAGARYLLQGAFLRAASLTAWPEVDVPLAEAQTWLREQARALIRLDD